MSAVTFESVTKRFGDVVAVDALTLDVDDQEFMVLLGPSGCGKSTALRMVAGLETVSDGSLRIGGELVNDVDARARDIAMVFQSYALYPHMTVRKNIESPLVAARRSDRLPRDERDQRVSEAASILGLDEFLDRKPGELSGGQRQRVALARAIVRRPQVFLMDEPLSNLDAKLRTQTRLELVALWRRLEATFLYVTHDQIEAMTMATRVAVLADGRLQQVGPPQDVYDRPANRFVAGFIGSPPMNFIAGAAEWSVDVPVVTTAQGVVSLGRRSPASTPGNVVIGIRPEHVRIGTSGLDAVVRNVELLGHERHVICDVGDNAWTVRQEAHRPTPATGERVSLETTAEQVHVFDSATEERID